MMNDCGIRYTFAGLAALLAAAAAKEELAKRGGLSGLRLGARNEGYAQEDEGGRQVVGQGDVQITLDDDEG